MADAATGPKPLQWSEELRTGIKKIDVQHRILIQLINHFTHTLNQDEYRAVPDLLAAFEDYAKVHFATEEELLAEHHYPEYEHHKDEHDTFRRTIASFQAEPKESSREVVERLITFLSEWVNHHIREVDKKYCDYLVSRGVS